MAIIQIDTDEVISLAKGAGNFLVKKDADEYLYKLLTLQQIIEQAIGQAKLKIEEDSQRLGPDFKTAIGEKTRVASRVYGEEFKVSPEEGDKLVEEGFAKKEVKYRAVTEKVKEYIDKKRDLPKGIETNIRRKVISLSLKK